MGPPPKRPPQDAPDGANAQNHSLTEFQRKAGTKSGEKRRDKPWRQFAHDEAVRLHNANHTLTLTDITERILKDWEPEKVDKVGFRHLHGYLSKLVDRGDLPRSLKKRTGSVPK